MWKMSAVGGASAPLLLIGGSALFIILISIFGFGGKETLIPLEIHFGMAVDVSEGPKVQVWLKTPLPAYVEAVLWNVSKREADGSVALDVTMFELFPAGDETNYGAATATFSLTLIDPSMDPILNTTMAMVPMLFKRDLSVGAFEKGFLSVASFSLNNWGAVSWGVIVGAVAMFAAALALLFLQQKKMTEETLVESILPD